MKISSFRYRIKKSGPARSPPVMWGMNGPRPRRATSTAGGSRRILSGPLRVGKGRGGDEGR